MRRRTASHCALCQIETSNGQLRVASPKTPALSNIAGQFDPCFVLGDTSRAECSLLLPRIAHSQIGVLELAISVIHSRISRVWTLPPLYAHRYMQLIIGSWRPKLSGMRPRTASYCVVAKMRPCCRIVMAFGILLQRTGSESRPEVSLMKRDTI